ncbi:MAG: type II toxin-antitoxin system mRNA interferase toxin, RelE/StbE family [Candidatus Gottesmanbacteria bacterium]|nr:type II toxin-antitoxin system mRNA interferase toxin, RelE/StbE family [Candidatus Gottesmanbacteria bacterium]
MTIEYHRRFLKHFKQRILPRRSLDRQYKKRLQLFVDHRSDALLADHALHGDMEGKRSFSISGDVRVIYRISGDAVLFYDIGTHNQVY